jgi:hypothetical protein
MGKLDESIKSLESTSVRAGLDLSTREALEHVLQTFSRVRERGTEIQCVCNTARRPEVVLHEICEILEIPLQGKTPTHLGDIRVGCPVHSHSVKTGIAMLFSRRD